MEPTSPQFNKTPQTIFRKGGDESGLRTHALEQQTAREDERRDIGDTAQGVRDYDRGITGARNAVSMGITVEDAETSPKLYGGPVSGAELSKAKDKKQRAKKTSQKEKKRR
jgi:hypothetical protein